MQKATNIKPIGFAGRTNARVNNPGITYNEIGVTYNDSRYTYGGIYGDQDVKPIFASVVRIKPNILFASDFQGTNPVNPTTGIPLGPGFFMFITN